MIRICPKCKQENDHDGDFCSRPGCGGYLRWAQTVAMPAVSRPASEPAEPAAAGAPAPAPAVAPSPEPLPPSPPAPPVADGGTLIGSGVASARSTTRLSFRRDPDEGPLPEEPELHVDAGGEAAVTVLVRNEDTIVDNYELQVSGLPDGWWTVTPGVLHLLPFSAGGDYEREVLVRLHPPRSPDAEARAWPVRIVAVSTAHKRVTASLPLSLVIAPFRELSARVTPERVTSRGRGRFAFAVHNGGNAPADVALAGEDEQASLHYHFRSARLTAPPGGVGETGVRVRPPKPIRIGRPADTPFSLLAHPLDADGAEPLRARAVLRRRPWVPAWTLLALPLLAAAALAAFLLFFNKAEVPSLRGVPGEFQAGEKLKEAGLELGEVRRRVTRDAKPGTVIGQDVPPGEKVGKGDAIGILVALGAGGAKVPDVVKQTLPDAEAKLTEAGFQVGRVTPDQDDPVKARVIRQVPAGGKQARRGSPVTLFVAPPRKPPDATTEVPAGLTGGSAAAAVAALAAAGLAATTTEAFSATVPAGDVIAQDPAEGEEVEGDGPVALTVSAGFPRLAYDDGRSLIVADGAGRDEPQRLPGGPGAQNTQPSWSPDGKWIAFRRGDESGARIFRAQADGLGGVRAITDPGTLDSRPAVSPDGAVVAFIRTESDTASQVCLIRASGRGSADCLDGPEAVGRPAWSADGRLLTVLAPDDQRQLEVLAFRSGSPSSPRAEDWRQGPFITDGVGHGERPSDFVTSAAFAPGGPPRLAVLANWGTPSTSTFRLFIGEVDERGIPRELAPLGGVSGCEVAWRSDGQALAVASHPCGERTAGEVRVVELDDPEPRTLPLPGLNPTWEPVTLGS